MRFDKWLKKNTESLVGKTVAISGSTGGLGKHICRYLASLGAQLVLLDRNRTRSEANKLALEEEFPGVSVSLVTLDLVDIFSVREATEKLKEISPDVFIHNAGAYSIPRCTSNSGYDNVFTINFASPYYMIRELMPTLSAKGGKVIAVGSIAHNYSRINEADVDFSQVKKASKVYGNAKAGQDTLMIVVAGNDEQFTVTALFDNLGKGASGAAVQNMNIMLGLDEATGLSV